MEGNTAWVLASSALVLFMTPGLAFFYGRMVRSKNLLGMRKQNFFSMGLCSDEEEAAGLDITQHAETAYSFGDFGSMGRHG